MNPNIPGYSISRLLGEGSMGRVFLADQESPSRPVALKILSHGGTKQVERFRREAQLLAKLEHDNIARVYSVGETAGDSLSLPWLAMEWVDGVPLQEYCKQFKSSSAAGQEKILLLIAQIARAVHFAHTRGVIHRDLKPANILVTNSGTAKVLDFGVAHMISDGDESGMTRAGEILGTVPYMSWEQLGGEVGAIDGRSDVYSLGVIAYELLTGALPFPNLDKTTVVSAIERLIRENPIPMRKVVANIPRDIELIVAKAIAREPNQRYSSAAEFAADIERFLDKKPIEARPPTVGYAVGLFTRRHRALSFAIFALAATLVVATIVSLSFAIKTENALQVAEQRLSERRAVATFVTGMLENADPARSLGKSVTVFDAVESARVQLDNSGEIAPSIETAFRTTLGKVYIAIGDTESANQQFQKAEKRLAEVSSKDTSLELEYLIGKANLLVNKQQYKETITTVNLALDIDGISTAQRVELLNFLGRALIGSQNLDEAEATLTTALSLSNERQNAKARIQVTRTLAQLFAQKGEFDRALALFDEEIEKGKQLLSVRHPEVVQMESERALLLMQTQSPLAEDAAKSALSISEDVLGKSHPSTISTRNTLINVLISQRRFEDASPLAKENYESALAKTGETSSTTLLAKSTYAWTVEENGDLAMSEQLYREAIATASQSLGEDNPTTIDLVNSLAMNLTVQNRVPESLPLYEKITKQLEALAGPDHPQTGIYMGSWGAALLKNGQAKEATPILKRAHTILSAGFGEDHPRTKVVESNLNKSRELESGLKK